MKKIGLLSDTHGHLDEAVFKYFAQCDEIWHAGDFGSVDLVDRLEQFKPLRGVYGNIDGKEIRMRFPEENRFSCEQVDVLMIHIGGYPKRYQPRIRELMSANPPDLFISGHSHILKVVYDQEYSCLHLNPGAAGKQGWHKVQTLLRFDVNGNQIQNLEVIELGNR
ncbi:metallophosphoesterase family protein [Albibacterium profundi]|uniref:Phosphoesterase n=1 Tax=Albibacterium profundi TaxID=3134906 RepID=A0ABV5CBT9_9SPHI